MSEFLQAGSPAENKKFISNGTYIAIMVPEYAKFAGLAGHVRRILKVSILISPDKMSSEKFDIRQTFHTSGENSKCPAKDCRFAGQNVRRGSNEFRVLCGTWKDPTFRPLGTLILSPWKDLIILDLGPQRSPKKWPNIWPQKMHHERTPYFPVPRFLQYVWSSKIPCSTNGIVSGRKCHRNAGGLVEVASDNI